MPKAKLSVTVDERLVDQLDELAAESSRSQVVESALACWLRQRRRLQLEDEIERYYLDLTDEDRDEDAEWAELGARSLDRA